MKPIQSTKYTTFFYFFFNNTKSLFDFIYLKVALCPLCLKNKANPFQSHSKPFFGRPNPVLSEIIGIFDKFRTNFLCKTKPFLLFENLIFYT